MLPERLAYSVVIPTCDRAIELEQLLRRLAEQVGCDGEIIVSDDSSNAEPAQELARKFPNARVIPGPRRGRASNRNSGASAARGDWIIFVDDDVIPDAGFIKAYLDHIAASKADVLEGRTYSDPDLDFGRFEAPVNETGGNLWSCNFAIRRGVFDGLGGFSAVFTTYGGEDSEFQSRLQEGGHAIEFVRPASVYHPPRPRPGAFQMATRWRATWVLRLLGNENPLTLLFTLPKHIIAYGIGEALGHKCRTTRTKLMIRSVLTAGIVAWRLPWWNLQDFRRIEEFRNARRRPRSTCS